MPIKFIHFPKPFRFLGDNNRLRARNKNKFHLTTTTTKWQVFLIFFKTMQYARGRLLHLALQLRYESGRTNVPPSTKRITGTKKNRKKQSAESTEIR